MSKSINIEAFLKKFNEEYDFLYEHHDRVAGYRDAVDAFDEFVKTHREFVGEFVNYRKDFISSDREAAAFMFALNSMAA